MTRTDAYIQNVIQKQLRPHQRRHLLNVLTSRYSIFLGPRQETGKSFVLSLAAVMMASGTRVVVDGDERIIPPHDVQIISKSADTAQNLIREVGRHVLGIEMASGAPLRHDKLWSLTRGALRTGRYIYAHSSNPNAIQGFTGSTIVDEWSKLEEAEQETYLSQAMSVGASKRYMRTSIATNADYEGSYVDRFLHDEAFASRRRRFKVMEIDVHGIHPGGLPERLEEVRDVMHPDDWARFFLNRFVSGASGAFAGVVERIGDGVESERPRHCVLLLDPAYERHSFGMVVAFIGEGIVQYAHAERHWKTDDDAAIKRINELRDMFACTRFVIDPGSVGYSLARRLEAMFGPRLIKAPVSSDRVLDNWTQGARQTMGAKRMRIEPGAKLVRSDFGHVRYDEKGKVVIPEIHADDAPHGCVNHLDIGMAALSVFALPEFASTHTSDAQVGDAYGRSDLERKMGLANNAPLSALEMQYMPTGIQRGDIMAYRMP